MVIYLEDYLVRQRKTAAISALTLQAAAGGDTPSAPAPLPRARPRPMGSISDIDVRYFADLSSLYAEATLI